MIILLPDSLTDPLPGRFSFGLQEKMAIPEK